MLFEKFKKKFKPNARILIINNKLKLNSQSFITKLQLFKYLERFISRFNIFIPLRLDYLRKFLIVILVVNKGLTNSI
jgi:hypothetical protein